jgi:hypothetical protein
LNLKAKTDIAQALKFFYLAPRKAVVFVISDFMAEDYEYVEIAAKNMTSQEFSV